MKKNNERFGKIYSKLAFLPANVLPTLPPCNPPKTGAEKKWPYAEYYLGERDEENRKHGKGTHHWTGAESLEWYTGQMLYNTMHGAGDYRWRYLGPDQLATTYEGRFYNNSMHGYGVMSYPDGRVFTGLFYKNYRWGPGVETHACLREDVGLWHGYQIIRLAWRPLVPSVAIDLVSTPIGANTVAQHRVQLTTNVKIIGEVNSALELLKKSGCEPLAAAEKWTKLYSKNCTDLSSPMCHVEAFDRAYYDNGINTLSEVTAFQQDKSSSQSSTNNDKEKTTYYAWNNNKTMIHMMKHCFTHEEQREENQLSLEKILSGSRSSFKPPGKHELDCRALLMASYLGDISNVATLINECDVVPDVTDVQGNSVIMYAACGDQPDTIHFLVEAGADVDAYNDACCTPLGITILRYVLEKRGVAYNAMLQALLPPPSAVGPPLPDVNILEWKINRENPDMATAESLNKASKLNDKPSIPLKKPSAKELSLRKKTEQNSKIDVQIHKPNVVEMDANTDAKDKHVYDKINTDYLIRVAEAFSVLSEVNPIPYIFEVNDMYKDIELMKEEEAKKLTEKLIKKISSKPAMKEIPKKPSRDVLFQEKEVALVDTIEQKKQEKMAQIMLTILQLMSEGADPRKVRCPQLPLFVATVSGCAELIRHLVRHGADINEVYPQAYGYSIIDVAVSGPLTPDNLEVIRALLQSGANPDHRLNVPPSPLPPTTAPLPDIPSDIVMEEGPTLLHAILARKIDAEGDPRSVEHRDHLLEMLLQYGCNPITQYKGHSAVDMAMNKSLELFDIFLKSPRTDLNAVINDSNQTVLVKIFHMPFSKTIPLPEKLQLLTNLLLFGADPLIKCQNGDEEYGNLFAFVKSVLNEKDNTRSNFDAPKKSKSDIKSKQPVKPTGSKTSTKPVRGANKSQIASKSGKIADDSHGDYKQALDLVVECARLLYIRWLQANLMKELIEVVHKYKYRHWTMILKEHNNKKCTSLWLTAHRGLEIWDVLKTTKKKIYNDEKILKQVLCIIHLYFKRSKNLRLPVSSKIWIRPPILFQEKELIEREVARFTREHRLATMPTPDMVPAIRPYVTPELTVKGVEKFNVCFECALPLGDVKIPCDSCNMIGFCSFDCVRMNIDRFNCHPCSSYLKEKYFPTPEETETNSEVIKLV